MYYHTILIYQQSFLYSLKRTINETTKNELIFEINHLITTQNININLNELKSKYKAMLIYKSIYNNIQ